MTSLKRSVKVREMGKSGGTKISSRRGFLMHQKLFNFLIDSLIAHIVKSIGKPGVMCMHIHLRLEGLCCAE